MPTSTEDVVIASSAPGTTITSSGTVSILSLTDAKPLTITGGSFAMTNASTLSNNLTLSGGTLSTSGTLTINGTSSIWSGGTLTGLITNAGTLDVTGTSPRFLAGTLTNSGTIADGATGPILAMSSGTTIVNQAGATFNFLSNAIVAPASGTGTFSNAGTLEMTASGSTANLAFALTNTGTIEVLSGTLDQSGSFSNFSGSTLTGGTYLVSGTGQFEFPGANIVTNAASIILDGTSSKILDNTGVNALAGFTTNAAGGQFTVQDGASFTTAGALSNAGEITVATGSSMTLPAAYTQTGGSTTVLGSFSAGSNPISIQGGTLAGTGTVVGNVTSSGIVSPGVAGPGILSITGNYTQTASASLDVDLGGLTVGNQSDQLAVSGTASLNGALNIDFINSYIPNTGDTIPILTYNTYLGGFATLNGNAFGNNQSVNPVYLAGQLNLVATGYGINVSPTSGLVTTQAGGTAQFQVDLNAPPAANVTIPLASSNTSQGSVSTSALVFTPSNWNIPQTVTVAGVNDNDVGPNAPYSILTGPAVSTDPNYNGLTSNAVAVTNDQTNTRDLQVTNLSVSPSTGLESGDSLVVNWDDTDFGNVPVTTSFEDQVMIVDTTTGQTLVTADVPYNESTSGPIAANGSFALQYDFTLPNDTAGAGQIEFIVTTNLNNGVYERNNNGTASSNNTSSITGTSTLAAADLQVTGITFTPSTGLQSSNVLTAKWNDTNTGNLAVVGNFIDSVTFKNLSTGVTLGTEYVTYNESSSGPIGAGQSAPQQVSLTLPDGASGVGMIQATIDTDYNDAIPEYNSSGTGYTNNTSSATIVSTLANYADLQVAGLVVMPGSGIQSGNTVTASWDDSNTGDGPVTGSFTDSVTVVNMTTGQSIDTGSLSYNETTSGPIAPGHEAAEQFPFTIPDGAAGVGTLVITVTTDSGHTIKEYDSSGNPVYGNNTSTTNVTSTLAKYADLIVNSGSLVVTPASPQSGGSLTATWTDTNQGDAAVNAAFSDAVLVQRVVGSTDTTIASGTVNGNSTLASGATSGTQSFKFTLPNGTPGTGDIRVTVTTDSGRTVKEYDSSGNPAYGNNTSSTDVTSTIGPYPDLQVVGPTFVPASGLESGQQLTIDWSDANTGTAATPSGWYDHVVVVNPTTDQTLLVRDVYYDPSLSGNGSVAAGGSRSRSTSLTLPDGTPGLGNLQVSVTTDYYESIFEYNSSGNGYANNTASATITSTIAAYPDLQVTGLATTPASGVQSGNALTINWDDSNTGDLATPSAWYDHVVVVNTTTGSTLLTRDVSYDPTLVGNGPIAPGDSRAQSTSFTLPDGTPGVGSLQISVTTDYDESLFEYNSSGNGYANNTATESATSSLASYPDLVASQVAAAASAQPGQQIPVSWTLSNNGSATATGPWTEQVYLATDSEGDHPILLTGQTFNGSLTPNQSVSRSATVQIPQLSAGNYWFVVTENPFGQVFEANTSNNTSIAVQPTNIAGAVTLVLSTHTVSDAAGSNATTATITRNTATSSALVVTLTNSDPNDVTVPRTVTIPAGSASATFAVGTINNHVVEGTQSATITASATGLASGSDTLAVTDTNVSTLTLVLNSHSVNETDPNPATYGTVTRNTSTTGPLVVSLLTSAMKKLSVPAAVTIPAGQTSATFPVTVINDQLIDGNETPTITATATGFVNGTDSAVVVDDNIPTLTLALAQQTVSEAAQYPATTGTVSIASPASGPITIALASSKTSVATVPSTVVIAAGQVSASFPIAAVDNGLDLGDQTAIITAQVETIAGVIVAQGSAGASLLLKGANGAALTVSFATSAVNKGTQATATVSRNTVTTNPLIVSLSSSDPAKATVPATVTIPAGQTSVSFAVTALNDHMPDGLQQVQVFATVSGFEEGLATLGITDVDLPDLVVSTVTAPATSYDNSPTTLSWTVTNGGQYPATGSWLDQVYLDPVGGPLSTTPLDTVPFNGTLNAGQSYTQADTIVLPSAVGSYLVRVVTDANQSLQELSFSNNTGTTAQALNVHPAYSVTVATTATAVSIGTPIPLSGVATMTSNGTPAVDVPVSVQILVAGTTRALTATTDSSGHYSLTFQPLQQEAGNYSVTAADPSVTNPAVQANFEIVGMTATPSNGNVNVVPNTPITGQITLTNLSNVTLTGLTATSSGGPAGLTVQLTPPDQIAGNGTATLSYSLDTTSTVAANGVVTIQVTTAQGAVLDIPLGVAVAPLTPILAVNPGYLNSGMVVGTQALVSFTVFNKGGSPTGSLQVSLPNIPYMTLVSPATIGSLAPGASSQVTLELSPAANLPLEQYTGTIAINSSLIGIPIPFTFTAITTSTGSVHVLVDDDYTFDEAGSPRVQGATVELLNPYDNTQVVATGTTDSTGAVTLNNVPAGPYVLQVTASGHSNYDNSYTVVAGIANSSEVFIQRQFVTYTWNVQQTTIQDTYQIQLQASFQTNVPAPVVSISAPSSIPTLAPGQSGTFNVTLTNQGLIAAQGVTLTLPTDAEYTFTALSTQIGEIPAQSSVVVPITVTRSAPVAVTNNEDGTTLTTKVEVPNPIDPQGASTVYVDYSNTGTVAIPAPLLELTATLNGQQGAFLSLNSSLAGLSYDSNTTPAGFSQNVQLLANGATPGLLEPGESERIPVYYAGWVASQWQPSPVTFSLSVVSTGDTQTINWHSVAPGLRLGSINAAAWNAITPVLTAQLGTTWGQYVQTLDNAAAYLAGIGEPTSDLNLLLSFEIEMANASYIALTLTTVTADDLPAPGMDLSFVQSFQQSISGRYTQGNLGYGWTNNWDIMATTMTNGDVVVDEDGISLYFSLQPNGSFAPEAGDAGTTLTVSGGAYRLVDSDGTTYKFNTNGTLNLVEDPHGNSISAAYNAQNQLVSLIDTNGEFLHLSYNANGDLAALTDSNGRTETYGYDPSGQFLTSYTDDYGTTNYTYVTGQSAAQDNALATITDALGTETFFGYDSVGRLIDVHENGGVDNETISYLSPGGYVVTDGDGDQTTAYFNRYGARAVTIDSLGNVTRSYYDSNLNLTKIVGPGGSTYTYTYDANGNLTSQTDPLGLTSNFTYNSNNDLTSFTDANGNTTSYDYDSQNDLLSIAYANGTTQSSSYNPLGEAISYLDARGQAIGLTYNSQGLIASENFADGTSFSYTYNAQGDLTSATDAQGNFTSFVYGDLSNPDLLTEVVYPDGTWLKFSYNIVGQRTQSVDQTGFTTDYIYDALGRLSELTDGSGNLIVLYTYDAAGNLIQKDMGNGTRTVYTFDADDQVLSITNYAPDHLTVNSFDDYTYDSLGNVLTDTSQDGEWIYSYDADSQLIQAIFTPNSTDPDGLTAQFLQYVYDAVGNRVSETVNGVITTYVTNNVNEYTSSTTDGITTNYQYDADGNLIAQTTGGSTTTYGFNVLNQLTSVNGPGLNESFGYDPLGNRVSLTINGVTTNFQIDPIGLGNAVASYGASTGSITHYVYGLGLTSQVSSTQVAAYYDFNNVGSTVGITNSAGVYVNRYTYTPFGTTLSSTQTIVNPFQFVGLSGVMTDGDGMDSMRARSYSDVTGRFISEDPINISGSLNLYAYVDNQPLTFQDSSGLSLIPISYNESYFLKYFHKAESGISKFFNEARCSSWLTYATTTVTAAIVLFTPEGRVVGIARSILPKLVTRLVARGSDVRGLASLAVGSGGFVGGEVLGYFVCPCLCSPSNAPTPNGDDGGGDTVGGPCTTEISGYYYYVCSGNKLYAAYYTPMSFPRDCTSQDVLNALAPILNLVGTIIGNLKGNTGDTPEMDETMSGGSGGGGGGPLFSPGASVAPPETVTSKNCDPTLNQLQPVVLLAKNDTIPPTQVLALPLNGSNNELDSVPTGGNDPDPLPVFTIAFANLGLIAGQAGNSDFSPSQAAQVVPTLVEYEQWEADSASIASTAAGDVEVAGDLALLAKVGGYLQAITAAENALFGGDVNWLDTKQTSTLQQWITDFFADAQATSDSGEMISSAEQAQLLATTLPTGVSTGEAGEFIDRWNRTVQYWFAGIVTTAQVLAGQSADFLDAAILQGDFGQAVAAEEDSLADGYSDPAAEYRAALTQFQNDLADQGVCTTVKLQTNQTATLTRSAFTGTLTITNSDGTGSMTNVVMDINITDANGNPANGEFFVSSPTYSGDFSVANGQATLPDYSSGSISFTFIPDDSAAATTPMLYNIGGTIGFTDPVGGAVEIPVFPTAITVYPQAELQLNYFLQQSVIGEDPFTPQDVIASEPATLGLLVTNVGAGTANNLSIVTAQPQIVQNEKGVADNFQIIGTQVGNQAETPSLTADLGDVAPGQTVDASFQLLSSLQGVFENFSATFSHSDALGGVDTSLISSVVTHILIHAGVFQYPDNTGATDYLAEDTPNVQDLPDTIYFSDGTTAPVNIATNAAATIAGAGNQLTYSVTASVTGGWDYLQLPDPGAGYILSKVVRSDGLSIPVGDQAWTSDRTISPTGVSTVDNVLHILDDNSTGSYLVYYRPTTTTPPTVASISPVSSPQSGPIPSVTVTFSSAIDPTTFTTRNLTLTLNGGANLINSGVTITQLSPTQFTIGGLTAITAGDGNYKLTVSAVGVDDFVGDVGTGSLQTAWATGTNVPVIVSVGATNPALTNVPVSTVDVILSEPIDPASFDFQALSLTFDVIIPITTSALTVTEINPTTYRIGGLASLTAINGDYVLTVSASGFVDPAGNSGVGMLSDSWMLNNVGPTVVSFPTNIQSPRNIVVPSIDVMFSEPINPLTFTYKNITYSKAGGPNLITSSVTITELTPTEYQITNFNNLIPPIDGTYTFTVNATGVVDLAGNNGTGSLSTSWVLLTNGPSAPSNLSISPDTGSSSSDGITDTGVLTLSGNLAAAGLMVNVYDSTTLLGSETVSGTTFQFPLNLSLGTHDLLVSATDQAGNTSAATSYQVSVVLAPPMIVSLDTISPDPRNTPVSTDSVTFSEAIDLTTFNWQDLSLTLNGGSNLITSAVTVSFLSGTTYQISGLTSWTAAVGTYVLTVNPQTIDDIAGNAGTTSVSTSWVMDSSASSTPTNLAITPNTGVTPGLTDTGVVILSGSLAATGQMVDVFDATTNVDLGDATIIGTKFSMDLNLAVGTHQLLITDISPAGSQSAPATFTIIVDETAPTATLPAIAGPRNAVVGTEEVTFSKPIIASTFTWQTISLTLNGGPNLITSAVTITLVSGNTYQINGLSGLTTGEGTYILTLNEAEIEAQNGLTGTGSLSTSWLMDTTAPTSQVMNTLGTSQSSDSFTVPVSFRDPAGTDGGVASGVSSLSLYVSVNNGPFTLYQTVTFAPVASGTYDFSFTGQDRNLYAFHSLAHDAAGNVEPKVANAIEATTSVPELNPPVTHVQNTSSYSQGVFTINWAGSDPDQNSGTPPGSIVTVDIYVEVDGGTPTLIARTPAGATSGGGVYSGTVSYNALADGQPHTYSFYSIGIDDQQKSQATPASPDVTISNITYTAPLAAQPIEVEKGITGRSFIEYLDVNFNQTASTSPALQALASGLTGNTPGVYVELLWYGENLTSSSVPESSVNLFGGGTTATVSLNGNDLSINLGPNGITSLLTENNIPGTGSPTKNFGDGWYALGIDPTGNPSNNQVFWLPFYRLFGDANGTGVVTGPYTTPGTDAYNVYQAEGQAGTLLSTDVDGNGVVNSKDFSETVLANNDAVGSVAPMNFPQFQLFARGSAQTNGNAVAVTQAQVQTLLPLAIEAWAAAGLSAADIQKLEAVKVQVANLGTNILGLEAANTILINQTAAGQSWYLGTGTNAFGLTGPGGEKVAVPGRPAAGGVDFLTVLEHELGHVLDLPDNNTAGDLMDITVGLGVSRSPSASEVAALAQSQGISTTTSSAISASNGSTSTLQASLAMPIDRREGSAGSMPSLAPVAAFSAGPGGVNPGMAQGIMHYLPASRTGQTISLSGGSTTQEIVDAALASLLNSDGESGDDEVPITQDVLPTQPVTPVQAIGVRTTAKRKIPQSPAPTTLRLVPSLAIRKNARPTQPAPSGPGSAG